MTPPLCDTSVQGRLLFEDGQKLYTDKTLLGARVSALSSVKTCIFCLTQVKMKLVHYTASLQEAVFSLELQALRESCC